MQAWIAQIKKEAFRLKYAGVDVSDLDLILALTLGLPEEYSTLVTVFDSTPPDQLTIDYVINRLINEEMRQWPQKEKGTFGDKETAFSVTNVTTKRPKKQVDVTKITCHFCDKRGHFKSDCAARKTWEAKENQKEASHVVFDSDSDPDWAC